MADLRIKDITTTITGPAASDDYFPVDGLTNGTRKISAYGPTFNSLAISNATGAVTLGAATETLTIAVTAAGAGTITTKSGQALTLATGTAGITASGTGTHALQGNVQVGPTANAAATFELMRGGAAVGGLYSGSSAFWLYGGASAAEHVGIDSSGNLLAKSTGAHVFGTTNTVTLQAGAVTATGAYTSGAPSGGTAAAWKFGVKVDATTTLDTAKYLQVDVGGTLYKVALVTS